MVPRQQHAVVSFAQWGEDEDEYFATIQDKMTAEEKMKDPLVLIGLFRCSFHSFYCSSRMRPVGSETKRACGNHRHDPIRQPASSFCSPPPTSQNPQWPLEVLK